MKKISVYARSYEIGPSGYYRIIQYIKKLDVSYRIRGLFSESFFKWFYSVSKLRMFSIIKKVVAWPYIFFRVTYFLLLDWLVFKPDTIIVSRVLIPNYTPGFIIFLFKKVIKNKTFIWDFDDHILESRQISQKTFDFFSEYSNYIIVTHDYLGSLVGVCYRAKILIFPTTDGDADSFQIEELNDVRCETYKKIINLVWVGTAGNLHFVESILPKLDIAAKILSEGYSKQLILNVVANANILKKMEYLQIVNIKWTREDAIKQMCIAHIGIMPLSENTFTKGKGGFKLIQYMSTGLPIIGSEVGFNKSIIDNSCGYLISENNNDWYKKILDLSIDENLWLCMGQASYQKYKDVFSYNIILKKWNKILNN